MTSPLLNLLEQDTIWGSFSETIQKLKCWPLYGIMTGLLKNMNREVLFHSPVHGEGHIERTILHGAFAAMDNGLSAEDADLLLLCCAYHDTGRLSDWLDDAHGRRSAFKLRGITGLRGEKLKLCMAAVEAHSLNDTKLDSICASYEPTDRERARKLALMLKDCDGLDRVRIGDLDTKYLRMPSAANYADFSRFLFDLYNEELQRLGLPVPDKTAFFQKELVTRVRDEVQDALGKGVSPMVLVLQSLNRLVDIEPAEMEVTPTCYPAVAGKSCGAFLGAQAFVRDYCRQMNLSEDVCESFRKAFLSQYRSSVCSDLRPCGFTENDSSYICASYLLDLILFVYHFLTELEMC